MPQPAQIIDRVRPRDHARHHRRDLDRRVRARHGQRCSGRLVQAAAAGQRQHRHQARRRHQIRIIERHRRRRQRVRELHLRDVLTGAANRTFRQSYSPSQQGHSRVTPRSHLQPHRWIEAYRFGHSLIRPFYVISPESTGGVPIFGPEGPQEFNLNGGRPIPADLVMVWNNILPNLGNAAARPPRKIDTKLSIPLSTLPGSAVPPPDPTKHLAVRNNRRGKRVGLPSGQQVAKAMRVNVLSNAALGLSTDPGWGGEAPLWYYILKEAELPPYYGERLGPVGGRIMAEVLVGLLQRDPNSYLYLDPAWKPAPPLAPASGEFAFVDLLRYAGAA